MLTGLRTKKSRRRVGAAGNRSSTLKSQRVQYSMWNCDGNIAPDQFGMSASIPAAVRNSPTTPVLLPTEHGAASP